MQALCYILICHNDKCRWINKKSMCRLQPITLDILCYEIWALGIHRIAKRNSSYLPRDRETGKEKRFRKFLSWRMVGALVILHSLCQVIKSQMIKPKKNYRIHINSTWFGQCNLYLWTKSFQNYITAQIIRWRAGHSNFLLLDRAPKKIGSTTVKLKSLNTLLFISSLN